MDSVVTEDRSGADERFDTARITAAVDALAEKHAGREDVFRSALAQLLKAEMIAARATAQAVLLKDRHGRRCAERLCFMQDEIIRLFFSMGVKDCANADTIDPVALTVTQILDPTIFFSATTYTEGLNDLRSRFAGTGRFATYYLGGANQTFHQHVFRPRFYETTAGSKPMVEFVADFIAGRVEQIGP